MIIAAEGLFRTVAYFILENIGLQYTMASNTTLIASALPVVIFL